jgi:hypothetical protein
MDNHANSNHFYNLTQMISLKAKHFFYFQKMITHEEDFDKSNLVLTVDTQRGLQHLFDYIIYLGIKVNINSPPT